MSGQQGRGLALHCSWLHCSRLSARLADIKCAACLHVLQGHDGPDVRRLENMRVCWEHASLAAWTGLLGFSLRLRFAAHREPQDAWQPEALPARR
jgi:hypothetical protein